jgi:hypothetical protein
MKMIAAAVVVAVSAAGAASPSSAMELAAKGKVVGPSLQPQAGVPVQVEGPQGKALVFTDKDGDWALYNLPAGRYQVKTVKGFANEDQTIAFTVPEKSFAGKWFSNNQAAYVAPSMTVKKDFTISTD